MTLTRRRCAALGATLALVLGLACEESQAPGEQDSITVTLEGDASALTDASKAYITLYGYDPAIADQEANIITQEVVAADKLPLAVEVLIPYAPEELIDPGDPSASAAMYYFAVHIDADGDGTICADDYVESFGPDGPTFFTMGELDTLTIQVVAQSTEGCTEPPK